MPDKSPRPSRQSDCLAVDLLRVARGLEADAHYLRARLFRAAALGVTARASQSFPRLGSGLEQLAGQTIADFGAQEGRASLAAALRDALDGIPTGQAPPSPEMTVSVCMRCGEVSLSQGRCPSCGAGSLASRPVLMAPYYEPAPLDEVLSALEITPDVCSELCAGLDDEAAQRGRWPVHDILDHVLGAQRIVWARTQRMLDEEEPDLGAGVPPPRASDAGEGPLTVADLLAAFGNERAELLQRVRGLTLDSWERAGTARNWGRTTVRQRLTYLSRHEQDHLGDLVESLAEAHR